ncbi:hypothetical protein BCEP27_130095 [Burkholderia cepacia]
MCLEGYQAAEVTATVIDRGIHHGIQSGGLIQGLTLVGVPAFSALKKGARMPSSSRGKVADERPAARTQRNNSFR